MEALDKKQIEQGRKFLLAALGFLAVTSLAYAYFFMADAENSPLFSKFTNLNWFIPPMALLMGAGVFQGSKPVRWILSLLLVLTIAFEFYLFISFGLPGGATEAFFFLMTLAAGVLIYMIMIDNRVEEFLLYQRSKNYGEWAKVEEEEEEAEPQEEKPRKGRALLDEDEEMVEEVETSSRKKKKKQGDSSWEDELGIYEED